MTSVIRCLIIPNYQLNEKDFTKINGSAPEAIFLQVSTHNPPLRRLQEVEHLQDLFVLCGLRRLENLDLGGQIGLLLEEEGLVSGLEGPDVFLGETAALKAYQVQAAELGRVPIGNCEGGNILHDLGAAAHHGVSAHPAELVNAGKSRENDVIFYRDVTGKSGGVGEDTVVSDYCIVGNMSVGEQVVVGTDPGGVLRAGSAMDGDELAEGIAVSYSGVGGFAGILQILTLGPDGGEGIEFVVFTDDDWSVYHDVGVEAAPRPDADVVADDTVGPNFHVSPDFGLGRDDGGGMNHNNAAKAWFRVGEWAQGESLGFPKFFTG